MQVDKKSLKGRPKSSTAVVNKSCSYCGKSVQRYNSRIKGYKTFFCNKMCWSNWLKSQQSTKSILQSTTSTILGPTKSIDDDIFGSKLDPKYAPKVYDLPDLPKNWRCGHLTNGEACGAKIDPDTEWGYSCRNGHKISPENPLPDCITVSED